MSKSKPADHIPQEPLPVKVSQGMLVSSDALPMTADKPPVCTWPLTTIEGRAKLHQMIAGSTGVLWDKCEQGPYDFAVTDIAASFGSWEPEDRPGELVEGPVFYLCGPSGDYHTGSPMAYRSLQQLALIEGPPPWSPPVILRAYRAVTRNRNTRLVIVFIGRGSGEPTP